MSKQKLSNFFMTDTQKRELSQRVHIDSIIKLLDYIESLEKAVRVLEITHDTALQNMEDAANALKFNHD
jgi:hypothetical protein